MIGKRRATIARTIILGLLVTGCSSDPDPVAETTDAPTATTTETTQGETPTETSPPTTVTATAPPTDAVVQFYGAYNASDIDAALAVWPSLDEGEFRVLADGLKQRVSVSCSLGAEPGTAVCEEEVARNDFTGPAGVLGVYTVTYIVEGGVIVSAERLAEGTDVADYVDAFGVWLRSEHPDVHADSYRADGIFPLGSVDDATTVIALVEEFLDQADDYPTDK